MTPYAIAPDTDHGTWAPMTRRRAEMEAEDERTSEELARRLGLRSWRVQHPEATTEPAPDACMCGCGRPIPETMRTPFATTKCRHRAWERAAKTRARWIRDPPPRGKAIPAGFRFGERTVVQLSPTKTKKGEYQYRVRCEAGHYAVIRGSSIRAGQCIICQECRAEQTRRRAKEG